MILPLDHIALTVRDPEAAAEFYARVLGLAPVCFAGTRRAVCFGAQKTTPQRPGEETRNHAAIGSGDLCLLTDWPVARTLAHLAAEGVEGVEGPVRKTGAFGPIASVYFRDPDGNLIEVSRYGGEEE